MVTGVPSPCLYHGPSAQGAAGLAASDWGRVIGVYGHPVEGLNISVVREASSVMCSPVQGDTRGSMVLGPVDILTSEGIVDVLLKSLEEVHDRCPRTYLWAKDVGSVRDTIQSRCLSYWSPGVELESPEIKRKAEDILTAYLSNSVSGVLFAFKDLKASWGEDGEAVLKALAGAVARRKSEDGLRAWAALRPVLSRRQPSCEEVMVRFL